MSTATVTRGPVRAGTDHGGVPARRAVIRWSLRLYRREWRQQLLVLGLLTVAVAATIWGAGVATNTPPPGTATYGTASALVSLPGNEPQLAAVIAALDRKYGPVDVIQNQAISTGTTQAVELRAQNPAGRFGGPLLALDSGHYPAGPGQVALTSRLPPSITQRQAACGTRAAAPGWSPASWRTRPTSTTSSRSSAPPAPPSSASPGPAAA